MPTVTEIYSALSTESEAYRRQLLTLVLPQSQLIVDFRELHYLYAAALFTSDEFIRDEALYKLRRLYKIHNV